MIFHILYFLHCFILWVSAGSVNYWNGFFEREWVGDYLLEVVFLAERLHDLDGVGGGSFAEVVGYDPEVECAWL